MKFQLKFLSCGEAGGQYRAEKSERHSNLDGSILTIIWYENQNFNTEQTEYELDEQLRDCVLRLENLWSRKERSMGAYYPINVVLLLNEMGDTCA